MIPVHAEQALQSLADQADPTRARCLRCCAYLRVALVKLAAVNLADHDDIDIAEPEIQAEVDRLLAERPALAERFGPDGTPIAGGGSLCPSGPAA